MGDAARADALGREVLRRLEQGEADRQADIKLRQNERVRYAATLVNGIATAVVSLGVAGPVLGLAVPGSPYDTHPLLLAEVSGGCVLIAVALHLIVRWLLRGLQA